MSMYGTEAGMAGMRRDYRLGVEAGASVPEIECEGLPNSHHDGRRGLR
jgi:hypothetical protein